MTAPTHPLTLPHLAFTAGTEAAQAAAAFERRFGQPPAQMNRALELRAASDRKPQLSDLRESGDLENDADVVAFLHHGGVMPENARPTDYFETTVVVRKNRHGNVGEVPLLWQPGRYRFVNSAKVVK